MNTHPRAVLVISAHHTGSWWLITQMLKHPEITAFAHNWSIGRLLRKQPVLEGDISIDGQEIQQSVATEGVQLLKSHWYQNHEIIGTVHYPQMDNIATDAAAREEMFGAISCLGLGIPSKWAASIDFDRKRNTAGAHELYNAYAAGDKETIQREIPHIWQTLRFMGPTLRPFLEFRGYQNLMWWS